MHVSYTELMEKMRPMKHTVRLDFPLKDCKVGELYKGEIVFRVVQLDMDGSTIELLDFKKDGVNNTNGFGTQARPAEYTPVPAPS